MLYSVRAIEIIYCQHFTTSQGRCNIYCLRKNSRGKYGRPMQEVELETLLRFQPGAAATCFCNCCRNLTEYTRCSSYCCNELQKSIAEVCERLVVNIGFAATDCCNSLPQWLHRVLYVLRIRFQLRLQVPVGLESHSQGCFHTHPFKCRYYKTYEI